MLGAASLVLLLHVAAVYARPDSVAVAGAVRQLLGDKDHKFANGDNVPLWASKVGPFTNPRSVRPGLHRCPPPRTALADTLLGVSCSSVKPTSTTACPTASPRMGSSTRLWVWARWWTQTGWPVLPTC